MNTVCQPRTLVLDFVGTRAVPATSGGQALPPDADMNGKVVAIAGACGADGAALARRWAGEGAVLMLGGERLAGVHALAAQIAQEGGCAQFRAVDPARRASIDALVAHTLDAYGRIDLLVVARAAAPRVAPSSPSPRAQDARRMSA